MSNEKSFYGLCKIMADLEDAIKAFEEIGLVMEPLDKNDGNASYKIFDACSIACSLATSLLDFPSVNEENEVYDKLMQATGKTVEEIAREVWKEYGTLNE